MWRDKRRSVFFFERVTAGGLPGGVEGHPLLGEALALADAVITDLRALGLNVWSVRDAELLSSDRLHRIPDTGIEPVADERALVEQFDRLCERTDDVLILAPETDGTLRYWLERAGASGARLLNATPEAASLCGDKYAFAQHCQRHGLATPPTYLQPAQVPVPYVTKPRDGAGCEQTYLVKRDNASPPQLANAIYQPFVAGMPVSVLLCITDDQVIAFPPAYQHISGEEMFEYRGGRWPVDPALARRAETLALQAVAAVPGLGGYVGVDLVLGEDPRDDRVIELNPRLTTSYLALRQLCRGNLMASLFDPQERLAFAALPLAFECPCSTVDHP